MVSKGMGYEKYLQLEIPACFTSMEGEILEYDEEKGELTCSFPVKAGYLNPMQGMQGGLIAGAMDNVFGPLSLLAGERPSSTVQMQLTYHRPVQLTDKLVITAKVLKKGRKLLYMEAQAYNGEGKLMASGSSTWMFIV